MRGELVRFQLIFRIEMKRYTRSDRLQCLSIDMVNRSRDRARIAAIFDGKALRAEIKNHARFWRAHRELGIQHLVDLPQARVGGVTAPLASRGGQYGDDANQKKASKETVGAWRKDAHSTHERGRLVHDFKAVFFDNRIGEHFFGDSIELFLCFIPVPAIKIQDEKFPLADVFYFAVAEAREGVMDGLPLRVEHRAFWHYPDVSFHIASITFPPAASGSPFFGSRAK